MKICLYLEFYNFLNGILYKNIGTGLLSSYENQKKSLKTLGFNFSERWDTSCDILQINTPWICSLYLIKKAKKLKKKIIIYSHVTAEDAAQVFWFNKYLFKLIRIYLTYIYSQVDIVFCPTEYTKNLLTSYGLKEDKLVVQSNGVDTTFYTQNTQKRELTRKTYNLNGLAIGTVGLVIPRKGVDIFLKLAQKYSNNQFIWFGKIYSKFLAKSLPKNLPANVQFTGFIQDIIGAFSALDIFIFLSNEENQGMVLLEAASIGLPILARDLPAYRGWLRHNENCLLAKNEGEAEKYLNLLIADETLRKHLSAKALEMSKTEDIKITSQKLLKNYKTLLK